MKRINVCDKIFKVRKKGTHMKNIYLFCTKPWVYLTELPIVILLMIAIAFNAKSEETFKFYPLIIFLVLAAIFIIIYFFRMIAINTDEVKYIGLFSSRDSAFITEHKTLYIYIHRFANMHIELFGDASEAPPFEWMKAEDVSHRDICLFRGRAIGGKKTAKRIIRYFALEKDKLESFERDGFFYEDEQIIITTSQTNEVLTLKIKFKITII